MGDKIKRIIAIIGVVFLLALYVATIIIALMGGDNTFQMLMTAVICTIIIPIILWLYSYLYKIVKNRPGRIDMDEIARDAEKNKKD